jgi:Protein of unknown function (DUF4038)/Putative collagen-binding domain of a collagenase
MRHRSQRTTTVLAAALAASLVGVFGIQNPPPARAATAFAFPAGMSANHRYLVDQNGQPYLIVGDSPHSLFVNTSTADAELYLADRQAHGINAIWVQALSNGYTGGRADGTTYDGIAPFTTPGDFATPNPVYWARVDAIIQAAANHGITVFLDPVDLAGWINAVNSNGATKDRAFGVFLGNRYKTFPNILWLNGNDFQTWRTATDDTNALAIAQGIASADPNHVQTVELDYYRSASLDDQGWAPTIRLNAAYTYYPTYDEVLHAYSQTPTTPVFMVEANYENENLLAGPNTTDETLRRQEWWTMTSGATGQLYGNHTTWTFPTGWQNNLDTTPIAQLGILRSFFTSMPWQQLVPDATFISAGKGTYDTGTDDVLQSDYATAAVTPDGAHAVVYIPSARTVTLDFTHLQPGVTARWIDPTTGNSQPATAPYITPGTHADGASDWVLALDAPAVTSGPDIVPLAPARLLETRSGISTSDGQYNGIGVRSAGSVTQMTVAGRGGVAANAAGAVLNVTVTSPRAAGWATVFPCGAVPNASTINFAAGQTVANSAITRLGVGGVVCVYASSATDLIIDVSGYVPSSSSLVTFAPARLLESRAGLSTVDGQFNGIGTRAAGSVTQLTVAGRATVPSNAAAVILNIAVTNPAGGGWITVFPCGSAQPNASTINFSAGQTVANGVIARVGVGGKVCLYTSTATGLIVDADGFLPASTTVVTFNPARVLETRSALSTVDGMFAAIGKRIAGSVTALTVAGRANVPSTARAVILNVTVVGAQAAGWITVFPCGSAQPNASNVNFSTGQTIANGVIAQVGPAGTVCFYTSATTDLLVDVSGYIP